MSEDTPRIDMRAALRKQLGSAKSKQVNSVSGRRAMERRAMERRAMAPNDGRLGRMVGPTVQLNVEIQEHFKEWLRTAKSEHGMTFTEIVEMGLELAREKLEANGKGAKA